MAQLRQFFLQRDLGANELQRDEPPLETEQPLPEILGEESTSEVPEGSSKSEGSLKTCNMPALVVHNVSQAHDTCNAESEKSESFNMTGVGEDDTDIRDGPSQPNDYGPAECQNNIGATPADRISSASNSENGSRFKTVVAPMYQQVFCTVGSKRPTVRNRGNLFQTTSTNFSQIFPLTDGKKTCGTEPGDDGDNKDKVLVIKTQESKQECSHKSLRSSTNKEGEKDAMVEESHVVQNVESLKVPEIFSDQSSNKSGVLETVREDKVVHPQSPNSLNPNFSIPELFAECLNLQGESQERDVTNDLRGQSTAGTAQDPLPEHPCEMKTSTCETQGQGEEQLLQSLEISLQTSDRAPKCFERDNSSDGLESPFFNGKAQKEKIETMWICRSIHGDTFVKQDEDNENCEETNAQGRFEHRGICQTQNTDVHSSKIMVKEENLVSSDEEQCRALDFTIVNTEVSEEDCGDEMKDSETEMKSESIDTREMEMETRDNKLTEMITAPSEKDKDKFIQDTLQGLQETDDQNLEEGGANKQRKEDEERSFESPSTSQGEKRTVEPAINANEMGCEKENPIAETFLVNIERQNVLEQEDTVTEEEFIIQSNNGDDHKAQEKVQEKNPCDRKEILMDLTSELESMEINELENEVRCSDARLNVTDNKAQDCSYASVNDVQHKQESDKENSGEEQSASMANETLLDKEEAFHNNTNVTHDQSKAEGDEPEHIAAGEWPCHWPEGERLSPGNTSSESDSDDEVELYMHCLRAVHSGAQAQKDKNRDMGSNAVKCVNRGKLLSVPMPSITESVDEEQPPCWHQDSDEETAESHPAVLPGTSEQRVISTNVSRWDTSNCENVSKTLLYATILVSFVFLAFYYDFLACFGLYILSIVWLCCQGDRQSVKNNRLG